MIAVALLSELLRAVLGDGVPTDATSWPALGAAGFDLVFAARATRADRDAYHLTLSRLRERPHLDPRLVGPDPHHQHPVEAAHLHPEIGYLNLVARKRA